MVRALCCIVFLSVLLGVSGQAGADLLAHWKLDEVAGTQASDATGNGYDGTLMGDPTWTTGVFGGAVEFDGAGDYVDFTDFTDWPEGDEPRSLTGWGLTYTVASGWRWIATYGSEGTSLACFIGMTGTDLYGGGYGDDIYTAGFWAVNEWHHIALTYDGVTARLYGDGIEVASAAKSWNTTLGRAHLGQQVNDYSEFWNGLIDDVRLYDHVLSVADLGDVLAGLTGEQAKRPDPTSAATDIPRDSQLGWAAGDEAVTHDVYFGTSLADVEGASRTDSRGVLVSQGQGSLSYDPGLMDFGQVYYWRIDEVSASGDISQGLVWSFTVEPLAYVIENIQATSNGTSEPGVGPENTVNGSGLDASGQHSTESEDMWAASPNGADPLYIEFAFDTVYKLHEMQIWNYNVEFELLLGFGIKEATIEYSENGTDWTAFGDVELARGAATAGYTANTVLDLGGIAAQYVRLTVNSGYGVMGRYGLSEVRFLYLPVSPREPQPADGGAAVSPNGVLDWRPGREAASHEVYLSADETAVTDGTALVDTVADSLYPLDSLDLQYGSTYYWKVVEVNEAEAVSAWEGAVWSFATEPYGVIDDFESYDDADNRIYDTWIDGWINETGSTVGHLEEPFAEKSIVHGGGQSMPILYDNTGGLTTSEADLEFATPQNWTGNGIQSLSLSFHGTADNGGQLYVKVNGTKVTYDGDADDISTPLWMAWNIDLSALGSLQNVTTLTIGIEGTGARGTLYVDDVRLYPRAVEYITPTEPDTANLVGYYALDGNPNDSSGHGHHGTEMNGATYVAGHAGQAASFTGVEQYIDFGSPADWPSGTAARSMCGWATTNSVDAGYRWIAAYGSPGTGQAMFIGINGTTLYGGGYGDDIVLSGYWVRGEWHHVGLTYDGSTARLYADGVEVGSAAKTWNLVPSRAHIGRQVNDAFEYWSGSVDEVRIYDRALTAGEMAWLAGRTELLYPQF